MESLTLYQMDNTVYIVKRMTNQLSEWRCLVKEQGNPRKGGLRLLSERPKYQAKVFRFTLKA